MPLAAILCPWVEPMAPVRQEYSSRLLNRVSFEFESSAPPSAEDHHIARVMRERLAVASEPLAARGFSVELPVRSDSRLSDLLGRIAGQSMRRPSARTSSEPSPDVVLALLTRRSVATLIESTALATADVAPVVCVGIDMQVPGLLEAFRRVSIVQPPDHESQFRRVVEAACDSYRPGAPGY